MPKNPHYVKECRILHHHFPDNSIDTPTVNSINHQELIITPAVVRPNNLFAMIAFGIGQDTGEILSLEYFWRPVILYGGLAPGNQKVGHHDVKNGDRMPQKHTWMHSPFY
ncbi:hypothetical protein XIS1_600055 [Xenorhabdus innexi]|uniref:Uncharacterized protein n=1 Tax=Xenorhabdus innexi TaxID=290109 RepID=A0A1N6MZS8_9GAMM|nr:hypothetical protein XIS1_600055 [Xenorhabdus innexi]